MKKTVGYFGWSFATAFFAILFGYWLAGLSGAWTVAVLIILELSLSLDNAVVNATVLEHWDLWWRRAFLIFGLPIAVFGMRLIFPVLIVSVSTGLGMLQAFQLALYSPNEYAAALMAAHHEVAAFGGVFLLMVALQFFMDAEKKNHWIPGIEPLLARLGAYEVAIEAGIALSVLMLTAVLIPGAAHFQFVAAGVYGFITYIGVKAFGQILSGSSGTGKYVAQGVGGLLYLEVLDASFSFDGVIGAFAITNNLLIIVAGLGVGAMFVRSLTIYLVEKETLGTYRYLEHGAFWAIGALAILMFLGAAIPIPETVTGIIGAIFIGLSVWSSVRANRYSQ